MKNRTAKILLLAFVAMFLISLRHITDYQYEKVSKEQQLEELQQKAVKNSVTVESVEEHTEATEETIRVEETVVETQPEETLEILPEYQELYNENEDLIGWIKIEGMVINYPVMQTVEDPIFYNHRDWNKNDSVYGLPLIDARCTLDSENIIIYSHHMKDCSMFGSLGNYEHEYYYKEHQIINFDTIYEKAEYQVIAAIKTQAYYNTEPQEGDFVFYDYINMDEEQFQEYINYVKELSLYDTGVTAEYGDKLITLCTCYYHTQDGRFLVVAKKIQ